MMGRSSRRLKDLFLPDMAGDALIQRERWVQDVLGLMTIVILVAALGISAAVVLGLFTFAETLPIYLLLGVIVPSWWAAHKGWWYWAGYVPAASCLSLGIFGSYVGGFSSSVILFYILAVLLAGMLKGRLSYVVALISIFTYILVGQLGSGDAFGDIMARGIVFASGLAGIVLLQRYYDSRLRGVLMAEVAGNQLLKAEIARREQAELALREHEKALQESEEKFRKIIQTLPMGIHLYTLDEGNELIFTGYNPAAEKILGQDLSPLLNLPFETAFPGAVGTEMPDAYRRIAQSGGVWKDRVRYYSDSVIQGIFDAYAFQTAPGMVGVVYEDISGQIKDADALRLSEEKFSTAFHTSPDSVNINRLEDGMYLDINQGFTKLMGYTREEVLGKSSLSLNIWANPADRERLVRGLLETGEVENLEAGFRRKDGGITIALMSARVIMVNGEKCILSITRDITERIQTEHQLREAHKMLEQAYEATLQGWAQALELRERETADHSRRVVELTAQVAEALGITGDALAHIRRGALLHDIGKMGVPDRILLKPTALTVEEWNIMRKHPEFGYNLLKDIDYLKHSADIPYCHHERWDGKGYPRGLRGEEIPLAARIFSVVDVYDALMSHRPYRPAWSEEAVREYVRVESGISFDPHIVEVFLRETGKSGQADDLPVQTV